MSITTIHPIALEKIKLFESKAAMLSALPSGKIKTIKVGNEKYAAVVLQENLHFFEYGCPHMGYPLFQAMTTPFGEISCPWHNYQFSLTNGEERNKRCRPLRRFKVSIDQDGIFVELPTKS